MNPGNPPKFWGAIEKFLRLYVEHLSPSRWRPWRPLFDGREGLYVLTRFGFLVLAVVLVPGTTYPVLGALAVLVTVAFLVDILLYHTSLAFVPRGPSNVLRTYVLSFFSFLQLPVAFAVFYRCIGESFWPPLTFIRAVYFSFVTITTLGYGDIAPGESATLAQILIILELVVGLFFLVVLLARLISLKTRAHASESGARLDIGDSGVSGR